MKKINILILSVAISIFLFILLTILQGKIVNKEATVCVYVSNTDIKEDTVIKETDYNEIKVPVSLVINTDAITDNKEIKDKYAKESINKGQIIFNQDLAKKEELKVIECIDGLERIAVKVKSSENGVAYQIKPKDRIHLYFTGKTGVIKGAFNKYGIYINEGATDNSLQTQKIISDIEILGIYDEIGRNYGNSEFSGVDTIVIAVEPDKAEMINNLRSQGTFDITR